MRKIKFRGKDKAGVWIFGAYCQDEQCMFTLVNDTYVFIKVIPDTVGQFTGLTDVDGNEIFEDDICKVTETFVNNNGEKRTEVYIMLVRYKNYKFEFFSPLTIPRDIQYIDDFCTIKVIGNIHDNHDLLKG